MNRLIASHTLPAAALCTFLIAIAACSTPPPAPASGNIAAAANASDNAPATNANGQVSPLPDVTADVRAFANEVLAKLKAGGAASVRLAVCVPYWSGSTVDWIHHDQLLAGSVAAAMPGDVVPVAVSQAWFEHHPAAIRDALAGSPAALRALTRQLAADAVVVVIGPWTTDAPGGLVAWAATPPAASEPGGNGSGDGDDAGPLATLRVALPLQIPEAPPREQEGPSVLDAVAALPLVRLDAAVLVREGFSGMPEIPSSDRTLAAGAYLRMWFRTSGAHSAEAWLIMPDGTAYRMWPDRTYLRLIDGTVQTAPQHAWLQLSTPGEYRLVVEAVPAAAAGPDAGNAAGIGGPSRAGRTIRNNKVLAGAAELWARAIDGRRRDTVLACNAALAVQGTTPLIMADTNDRLLMVAEDARLEWQPGPSGSPGRLELVDDSRYAVGRFPFTQQLLGSFGRDGLLQAGVDPTTPVAEGRLRMPFETAASIGGATWVWPFRVTEAE